MTIDERLDKLAERHEALTQTVEIIASSSAKTRNASKKRISASGHWWNYSEACSILSSNMRAASTISAVRQVRPASPQKLNLTPSCAAKGIPTVVPGPKKSPSAPAGTRKSFSVTGRVEVQAAFKQYCVTFPSWFGGTDS